MTEPWGNPALEQKDKVGDFLRVAAQGIITPGLLRVECFSRYTEVMQSSIVWTIKHPQCCKYWVAQQKQMHLEATPGNMCLA